MGPDEHISRQEMAVFAEYVFAKLAQIGTSIAILMDTLTTEEQAVEFTNRVARDPSTKREQDALVALEEFEEIRRIAAQYFAPDK